MADLANLKVSVDSREVKTATKDLDALGAAAESAERDVRNVGTASQSTGSAMRNMTNIIQQGEQAQIAAANANRAVGQTGQLARHHMMNLGFQFQDLGVQIASGQNPLVAFVQQGAQIAGVMAQAQIGIGGVIRAFGSMAAAATMAIVTNPILLGIAAAAGLAAAAFSVLAGEINKSGEVEAYAKSIGMTAEEIEKAGGAGITTGDIIGGLWTTISEALNLQGVFDTLKGWFLEVGKFALTAARSIYVGFTTAFDAIRIVWANLPAIMADVFVSAFNNATGALEFFINNFSAGVNKLFGTSLLGSVNFGRMVNANAGAASKAMNAIGAAYDANGVKADALGAKIMGNITKEAKERLRAGKEEKKAREEADRAKKTELEKQTEQSQKYLASLQKETAAIGKTPIELKRVEVAAAAAAAAGTGLAAAILAAGAAWEKATSDKASADFEKNIIKPLQDELALVGLTGDARSIRVLEMEKEAFVADLLAKGVTDATGAWERYYKAKLDIIKAESAIEKERKEAEKLKQQLEGVITLLDDIAGGAASKIKDIVITVKANFDKEELKKAFGPIAKTLGDALKKSGLDVSKLGKTFGAASAGAQVGTSVDAIFKGLGVKSSKMGAQVGGAIGGAAFGPVGAIAGSILGGILGGMLKKTKTGSATISQIAGQGMQTALSGNSAALKEVSNKMATGLLKGLGDMAEQLGGTLGGNVKLSIGMRKNDYVVDPTGAGRTKGSGVKNFGTDQAAAIAYVTQLAIQQGIVTGISAGAQTLIRAGEDLNAQVQKALKFDQVFKDLLKETDPLQYSLDELSVEMAKLKTIFAEAGASAADYAKLEELYAIKQAKAVFEANRPRRELEIQLMEAQGDAVASLAAKRALELEGMDASLRALQQQVWAAEDAKKATEELAEAQTQAAEEAMALANERRSLEIDLMDALGNSTEALIARRALELEGIDATLRGLQTQIWAAQDAKEASEAAAEAAKIAADEQAQAMETAAKLTNDRRELEIQLMEAQGMAIEALAARRTIELETMDASLRSLKEQIWAAQAKSEADELAAKVAAERAETEAKAADDAAQAMQKYMETLADVSQTVVDEINRLRGINTASSSALLKAQFATLTAQARTGNLDALGKLPELSRSIEEATLGTATSALEVARIRAWLDASLSETLAQQTVSGGMVNATSNGLTFDGNSTASANAEQTSGELSNMSNVMYNALYQIAKNTGKSYELMDRWDGDGLPDIREDASDYY